MTWKSIADLFTDRAAPVALLGAPMEAGSVTPGRCDLAPETVRRTLRRFSTYDLETGEEVQVGVRDLGDVDVRGVSPADGFRPIVEAVRAAVSDHDLTLLVGGNNAVTRPGVHALGLPFDKVGLITLDAHFDMRDTSGGLGNGNPVRALREDGLPGRNIAQVGLAPFANSADMHRDAVEGGHLVITIAQVRRDGIAKAMSAALDHVAHCEAVVVDCDIDVIDRAQFPGAPGARPGGMAVEDFFAAVRMLASDPKVRLIDLTEWDPPLDPTDLSALTAARWVAECLAGFEER